MFRLYRAPLGSPHDLDRPREAGCREAGCRGRNLREEEDIAATVRARDPAGLGRRVPIGWSFLTGVTNELDTTSEHSSLYIALFFIGLGIVIVGIVFALVGIVRRAHRTISLIALVLSMLPSFVVLVLAALLFL